MSSIWNVRRDVSDRKVSGLASGLARNWNVDPVLVRVGFAVLALSGGIGAVLYVAGWLMIPEDGKQRSTLDDTIPQTRSWSAGTRVAIVAAACLVGLVALSSIAPFSFGAALVLAAVWYFGYYRNRPQQTGSGSAASSQPERRFAVYAGEPTPFTEAARAWQDRIAEYERGEQIRQQAADAPAYPRSDQPAQGVRVTDPRDVDPPGFAPRDLDPQDPEDRYREEFLAHPDPVGLYTEPEPDHRVEQAARAAGVARRRSARRVGLVTAAGLVATMGALALVSWFGIPIGVPAYLAAALLVLAVGLLAAARFGRPRGLAFITVLTAVAMLLSLAATRVTQNDLGAVDVRTDRYVSAASLPATDHLDAGQLTVDLRDLTLDADQTFSADVGTGRLIVLLPKGEASAVSYRVDDGLLTISGRPNEHGPNLSGTLPRPPSSADEVLQLKLAVGHGQLEVRR